MTKSDFLKLKAGDVIITTKRGLDITKGRNYTIMQLVPGIGFYDDAGDFRNGLFLPDHTVIHQMFEKVSDVTKDPFSDIPSDVTEIVRNGVRYVKVVSVTWKAV